MGVDLTRRAAVGVTKPPLHHVLGNTGVSAGGSGGVPRIVERDDRDIGVSARLRPLVGEVLRVVRLPVLAAEQVAAVVVQDSGIDLLNRLARPVSIQLRYQGWPERYRPLALALG